MEGLQTILEFFHLYEAHMLALVAGIPRMLAFFATALIFSQAAMTRLGRAATCQPQRSRASG